LRLNPVQDVSNVSDESGQPEWSPAEKRKSISARLPASEHDSTQLHFRFQGTRQWTGERREVFLFSGVALTPAVIQMLNVADDLSIQIIKWEWPGFEFGRASLPRRPAVQQHRPTNLGHGQ